MLPLQRITVERNDRFLVAVHNRKPSAGTVEETLAEIGAELLSTVQGIVTELVITEESNLHGVTLAASDFRQRYNGVVLAVHRDGVNVTDRIAVLPLQTGDTLLVITALNNLGALQASRDFVMTDDPSDQKSEESEPRPRGHALLSWMTLLGVVLTATLSSLPIHYCAMVGALVLLWMKVLTPREAYASIDWQVLLMLYGLLGLGMAMEGTGTARWLAENLVGLAGRGFSAEHLPLALLWLVFLLTLLLTEVLSNNATAVMMIPIVVKMAQGLDVSVWPYVMAVTVASSCAFALPMGYQTHMMVYGPGGYKFRDFLRVGIPLNLMCWVASCLIIPWVWPFRL